MAAELLPERLPKQWSYGVTRDGRVFFIDDGRRLTTWLHPVSRRPIQTGLCNTADLPQGWELDISPEGTVYYVDHVNCSTQSKKPSLQMQMDPHPEANQSPGFNSKDPVQPNQRKTPGKPKVLDKAPAAKRSANSKVYLRGWLYKQDTSGLKQWKKKWCILADFGLFFYKDDDEKQDQGSILLPSYQISTCYVTEPVSKKYAFKLEHSNMKTYYFAAESIESMERWVLALQQSAKLERTPGPDKERNNNYITPTHERYPDNGQQRDYHSRSNPSSNHSNPSSPDDRFRDNSPMNLRRDPYQNTHDLSRNSQSSELSNLHGNNKSWQNPATFSKNVDNRLSQSDIGSPNDQSQGGSGYFYPGYSDSLELGKSVSKQPLLGSRDPMPSYIIDNQGYDGGGVIDQDGRHRDREYYDDDRYGDGGHQKNDFHQQSSPHQRSNSNTSWDKYAPSSEGRSHNQPWNKENHQDFSPKLSNKDSSYSSRDPGGPQDSYSSRDPGGVRTDSYTRQDPRDSFKESGYDPRNSHSERNPLEDTRKNYSSRDPRSDERDLRNSNRSNPRDSHRNNDKGDNRQQGQGHTAPAEYSNPHQSLNNVPDNYPEDSMGDDQDAERGSYSVRKQELSRSMSELSKPQTMDSEKIRELYQSGGSHRKEPAKNKTGDVNQSSLNYRSGYPTKMDTGSARSSISETRKGSPKKLQHWQHRDLNSKDISSPKTQNVYESPQGHHGREDSFEDRPNRQEGSEYPQHRHQRYPSDDRQNQPYQPSDDRQIERYPSEDRQNQPYPSGDRQNERNPSDDRQNQRGPSDESQNQPPDRSKPSSNQTRAGSTKRNPGLTVTTPDYVNVQSPDDSGGGYSEDHPNRPPLPAALRNMIINELAQNRTPQTSSDYLQSAENSQIRFNAPKFFQYPSPRTPSNAAKPDAAWHNQENSNNYQQPVSQRNQDHYGSKDSSINNLHADGIRQAAREAIAQKVRDYEVSLSEDRDVERAKSNSNLNVEGDRFNKESARDQDVYDDQMKYNDDQIGSPHGHFSQEDLQSGENEQNDERGNMNSDPMMESYLSRPRDQRISMASSASGLRASASDWPWNKPRDPSAPDDSHRDYQCIDNDIPDQDFRNEEDPRFSYASQTSLKQANYRSPYPNESLQEEIDDEPQNLRKSQGFSFPQEDLSRLSFASHDADDRDRHFSPERDPPSQSRGNLDDDGDDPEDGQNDAIEPHYSTVDKNRLSNNNGRFSYASQTSEQREGRSPPYLRPEPSRESYASPSSRHQGETSYPGPNARGDMLPPYQYDPSRVSYVSQLSQPKEVPIYAKINDPLLGQLSPPNSATQDNYQDAVPRYGVDRTRYTDPNFKKSLIQTVKEDPSMADEDVLETNLRTQKKHTLNGHHLRLSISAGDLIGKTHDELVLLLIQLRRNQSEFEKERDYYRQKLDEKRPFEQKYKRSTEANSPTDRRLQGEHQQYMENKYGMEEAEKKLEVYKPLVNLVDNMVTMGSLYGGDNYMLATQYKKHLLRPDQYTAPKELLEFSRQRQEDKIIEGIKEDIKQLDHEEVDLEEKLERLYVLDRQLQEQSFMVTSIQEDRVLLEKALQGILKQQDDNCDVPREMAQLTKQQRTIEKEISWVMHQLAEASKKLEDTSAENSRLEHEVALLRSKVHGELTRSRSAPSLTNDNFRKKASLEKDLAKVKNMMSGLSKEGARLTQAMNTLRRSNSSGALAQGLENDPSKKDKKKGTYIETDLDTMEVVDLAVSRRETGVEVVDQTVSRLETSVMGPEYPERNEEGMDEEKWDIGGADDNTKRFFGIIPKEKPKAQTVRDVKRQSEQRREKQKKDGEGDGHDVPRLGEINSSTNRNQVYAAPAVSSYNHNRYSSSVSDASSMEPAFQTARPPLYENLGQSENSQQVGDVKPSPVLFNASASTQLLGPKPFVPYQEKPAMTKIADKLLPIRTVSPINATTSTITDSSPVISQPSVSSIQSTDYTTPKPYGKRRTKSRGQRYLTISSSEPLKLEQPFLKASALQSPAGDLISNAQLDNTPNVVRSTGMMDDLIDEYTIDRMVLFRPEKITIPDRYDPDSDDEELTEEQREYRRDKAERIRRILTNQSLSWSKADLSSEPSPSKFHQHIEEEKMRHHQLLAINHELAQQVTLRTKQQAAERRKTWTGTDNSYQDSENDYKD